MKAGSSRKIAYILGAGFSFGTNHEAHVGHGLIRMPLQDTLFEELCVFHHRRMGPITSVARYIRQYFSPITYRSTKKKGSKRHSDLFGLSIEEIVTFFDELIRTDHPERAKIQGIVSTLQEMTIELVAYLSTHGSPGQNKLLRDFVDRIVQTDVLITFNWDTLLDQVLANRKPAEWSPK
jgi:hypothetical protein